MFKKLLFPLIMALPVLSMAQAFTEIDAVDTEIEYLMKAHSIPGMSIATIDADGSISYKNFGKMGPENSTRVDENTIYEIGSITKTMTAGLLHIYIDDLDQPVNNFISEYAQIADYDGTEVTIRHLLSHHSGLPRLPGNMYPEDSNDPYVDYTNDMMYEFVDGLRPDQKPGEEFGYSNLGYMLLGHLAEIVSGKSMDELVAEHISDPLGLSSTSRILADSSRFATPTSSGKEVSEWNFDGVIGLGELRSTSAELIKYVAMMMGHEDTDSAEAMRAATEYRKELSSNRYIADSWFVSNSHDDEIFYHGGGTMGFRTFAGYSSKTGKGVVVLSNSGFDVQQIGMHLLNDEYDLPEVAEYMEVPDDQLARLTGQYESEALPDFIITKEEGRLYARLRGQSALPLDAISETEFENDQVQARIIFDVEGEQATHLTLHQGGQQVLFTFASKAEQEPEYPDEIDLETEILELYTGTYRFSGMEMRVSLEDDGLYGRITGQEPFRMYASAKDEFFLKVVEAEITFHRDENDSVTALTLFQAGQQLRFERR